MQTLNSKLKINPKTRCYKLSIDVIRMTDNITNNTGNRIIINQLIRSVTSIGANLVEGSAASSRREYKKFFEISLKSANESKYWLGLLRDTNDQLSSTINPLLNEVNEISNILAASILTLKKN